MRHVGITQNVKHVWNLLDKWELNVQWGLFECAMMSNAWVTMGFDKLILLLEMNSLTKFWCTITANQVFCHVFFEYIKLVEIVVIHVFRSMKMINAFHLCHF
jgi:hypothetical protein